jgi:hypothetical protein
MLALNAGARWHRGTRWHKVLLGHFFPFVSVSYLFGTLEQRESIGLNFRRPSAEEKGLKGLQVRVPRISSR